MLRSSLALSALAACLIGLAGPGAAHGWQSPERLSGEFAVVGTPRLAQTRSGTVFAGWNRQGGLGDGARTGADLAVRRRGTWAPPLSLGTARVPRFVALADLDGYAGSRAMALTVHAATRHRLAARLLTRSGRAVRVRILDEARTISAPQAVLDEDGAGVVSWGHRPQRGGSRIQAAYRRARGGLRSLGGLSRPGAASIGVGFAGDTATVAWRRDGRLEGRISRDGGASWGATLRIGRAVARQVRISVAVSPRGAIAIAWCHQTRSEGGDVGPAICEARLRPVGRGFGPRVRLESFEGVASAGGQAVEVVFVGERGLVVWQGRAPAGGTEAAPAFAVRGARLTASGIGDVATLSPPAESAALEDLAALGRDVGVVWRVEPSGVPAGLGSLRAVVGVGATPTRWGAPEPVSPDGQAAGEAQLAWGPGRELTALWRARTGRGDAEAAYAASR